MPIEHHNKVANESITNTARYMNEIRFNYLEKNNKLCDIFIPITQRESENHQGKTSLFGPVISNQFRDELLFKVERMRKDGCLLIEKSLENYVNIESSKIDSSGCMGGFKTRRFSKRVIDLLESSFQRDNYPSDVEKSKIAQKCRLTTKQVANWFTNKRNRNKHLNEIRRI